MRWLIGGYQKWFLELPRANGRQLKIHKEKGFSYVQWWLHMRMLGYHLSHKGIQDVSGIIKEQISLDENGLVIDAFIQLINPK